MQVEFSAEVHAEDLVRDMSPTERWELLQIVWDHLVLFGAEEDWASFCEENGINSEDKT